MAAMRFVVHGRVQGVGFRWWVWRQATRLGLRGLARNLRDGSVEVIVEGLDSGLVELERLLDATELFIELAIELATEDFELKTTDDLDVEATEELVPHAPWLIHTPSLLEWVAGSSPCVHHLAWYFTLLD